MWTALTIVVSFSYGQNVGLNSSEIRQNESDRDTNVFSFSFFFKVTEIQMEVSGNESYETNLAHNFSIIKNVKKIMKNMIISY